MSGRASGFDSQGIGVAGLRLGRRRRAGGRMPQPVAHGAQLVDRRPVGRLDADDHQINRIGQLLP